MASTVSNSRAFRVVMACSTLRQAVFWVRMAPMAISNGVSPGHQWVGP